MSDVVKRPLVRMAGGLPKAERPFFQTGKRMLIYSKKYGPAVGIAILAAVCSALLQIIGPDQVKEMTNAIAQGLPMTAQGNATIGAVDLPRVASIGFFLLALYLGAGLLTYVENVILATVTQKISKSMRKDIVAKIDRLPLKYFDQTSYGDVLSRITNDVDTIGQSLNQSVASLISAAIMFFGVLFMMCYHSVVLTVTAVSTTLIGVFLVMGIMQKSQKYFFEQQKHLGEANGFIEEMYSGHTVVKAYHSEEKAKAAFAALNDRLYLSAWKSQFLSGLMMPVMHFVGNLGYVAVCVVGAVLVVRGQISFGVIVAFMMYIRMFTQPLTQVAQATNSLQSAMAAGARVFEFLDAKEMRDEQALGEPLTAVAGRVAFRDVVFGYEASKPVIRHFNADVQAGEKIAIVGPTGAGKTTLVNLLMKFYEIDGGDILIDGVSIRQLSRANVHDLFAMVLQDSWTFAGSILENIKFNQRDVSDAQVVEACQRVGLHHFITTLPEGYDTVLKEDSDLSEGQKQLLSIARAMVKNAPMLILDEATSSIDTRTERMVQAAMDQLTAGKTSFVIAHRLSTIKNADTILVVKDGDIIESGSHEALLAQGGFYKALYHSQFEGAA